MIAKCVLQILEPATSMSGRHAECRNYKCIIMEQLFVDFLKPLIKESLREALNEMDAERKEQEPRFITRAEVADLLGVSLVTVHSYVNRGLLQSRKIGNRTLFAESEVLAAIKGRKVYRFKHTED